VNASAAYVRDFLAAPLNLSSLTTAAAFATELERPIPPLFSGGMNRAEGTVWCHDIIPLTCHSTEVCHETLVDAIIASASNNTFFFGRSEKVVASIACKLLGDMWATLFDTADVLFDFDRYTSDTSTQQRQPGYCLWMNSILLCKGEHKEQDCELLEAERDLVLKMPVWNTTSLAGIPFVCAYAVGGQLLTLSILRPDATGRVASLPILGPFKMSELKARFEIVRVAMNMARIFIALKASMGPEEAILPLYKTIDRADGGTLVAFPDYVQKVCPARVPMGIYALLQAGVPHAITVVCYKVINGNAHISLQPVCLPQHEPSDETSLKNAIHSVLHALEVFHAAGYVHRDVRWPNILQTTEKEWLLADFEHANISGETADDINANVFGSRATGGPQCTIFTTRGYLQCGSSC
jgi:hypothetical protein